MQHGPHDAAALLNGRWVFSRRHLHHDMPASRATPKARADMTAFFDLLEMPSASKARSEMPVTLMPAP